MPLENLHLAIEDALKKATVAEVLGVLAGAFVGIIEAAAEEAGHDPDLEMRMDGGKHRDITIHATKTN